MQDHNTFRWPKNNVFFGRNYDIQPDPVDQNGLRLLVGIVEPVKRLANDEIEFQTDESDDSSEIFESEEGVLSRI